MVLGEKMKKQIDETKLEFRLGKVLTTKYNGRIVDADITEQGNYKYIACVDGNILTFHAGNRYKGLSAHCSIYDVVKNKTPTPIGGGMYTISPNHFIDVNGLSVSYGSVPLIVAEGLRDLLVTEFISRGIEERGVARPKFNPKDIDRLYEIGFSVRSLVGHLTPEEFSEHNVMDYLSEEQIEEFVKDVGISRDRFDKFWQGKNE